jgi:hypothetical protein
MQMAERFNEQNGNVLLASQTLKPIRILHPNEEGGLTKETAEYNSVRRTEKR